MKDAPVKTCFNCGTPMEGTGHSGLLRCCACDITEATEAAEISSGYFNPVLHVKFLEVDDEKIFYIDHSASHIPSPG